MKVRANGGEIVAAGAKGSTIKTSPLVSLQGVTLGYDSAAVLQGVDLAIYPGTLVGLAGPNGSGKTTLFRTILGLLAPLDGTLLRSCPLANFGYVPQSAALDSQFPLSAEEIVEMGAYGRVHSFSNFSFSRKEESCAGASAGRHESCQRKIVLRAFRWTKAAGAHCARVNGRPEDHDPRRTPLGSR